MPGEEELGTEVSDRHVRHLGKAKEREAKAKEREAKARERSDGEKSINQPTKGATREQGEARERGLRLHCSSRIPPSRT